MIKEIHLAHTQGFCAGVSSAIDTVERALAKFPPPIYVFHDIVHNTSVIQDFTKRGVIFVDDLAQIPIESPVILSAHGVGPQIYETAKNRSLRPIDATCPLVTKVHREAIQLSKSGVQTILIGHRGHQELVGTSGYVTPSLLHIVETEADIDSLEINPSQPVGYLTQTTLSVTETAELIARLKQRFPGIIAPPKADICYATQNRQMAITELAKRCEFIIVCGSPHSSNSNRLCETAKNCGIPAIIIDSADELDITRISNQTKIGISSGASVPRAIVDQLVMKIQAHFPDAVVFQDESIEKGIYFKGPKI